MFQDKQLDNTDITHIHRTFHTEENGWDIFELGREINVYFNLAVARSKTR